MKQGPKKSSQKQNRKKGSPKTNMPTLIPGSDNPINQQKNADHSKDDTKETSPKHNEIEEPEGAKKAKKKWDWDKTLKVAPIMISALSFGAAVFALYNTNRTFRITQEQNKEMNEPYLVIKSFRLDSIRKNECTVVYSFYNLQSFPAQMKSLKTTLIPSPSDTINIDSCFTLLPRVESSPNAHNVYIVKGEPTSGGTTIVGDDDEINAFRKGNWFGYFFGEVLYDDAVTGNPRKYRFMIKMKRQTDPKIYIDYLVNDNKDDVKP